MSAPGDGSVTLQINGKAHAFDAPPTVADILDALGIRPEGVAVAVERRVVPRSQFDEERVGEGQSVEILRAVGGG